MTQKTQPKLTFNFFTRAKKYLGGIISTCDPNNLDPRCPGNWNNIRHIPAWYFDAFLTGISFTFPDDYRKRRRMRREQNEYAVKIRRELNGYLVSGDLFFDAVYIDGKSVGTFSVRGGRGKTRYIKQIIAGDENEWFCQPGIVFVCNDMQWLGSIISTTLDGPHITTNQYNGCNQFSASADLFKSASWKYTHTNFRAVDPNRVPRIDLSEAVVSVDFHAFRYKRIDVLSCMPTVAFLSPNFSDYKPTGSKKSFVKRLLGYRDVADARCTHILLRGGFTSYSSAREWVTPLLTNSIILLEAGVPLVTAGTSIFSKYVASAVALIRLTTEGFPILWNISKKRCFDITVKFRVKKLSGDIVEPVSVNYPSQTLLSVWKQHEDVPAGSFFMVPQFKDHEKETFGDITFPQILSMLASSETAEILEVTFLYGDGDAESGKRSQGGGLSGKTRRYFAYSRASFVDLGI